MKYLPIDVFNVFDKLFYLDFELLRSDTIFCFELNHVCLCRWKSGEMSVYLELVNLLLKQLILSSKITESIVNEVSECFNK